MRRLIFKQGGPRAGIVAILLLAVLSGFALYRQIERSAFVGAYRAYAQRADSMDNAAFVPAAANNPIRQQLNNTLVRVLSDDSSAAARLEEARSGLEYLKQATVQIDQIENLEPQIAALAASASIVGDITTGYRMSDIVGWAKQRAAIVSDIRALSYRANYETQTIFERIIEEGGTLTPEHIIELNNKIPAVEEQFNRRSNLYRDLETVAGKIHEADDDF